MITMIKERIFVFSFDSIKSLVINKHFFEIQIGYQRECSYISKKMYILTAINVSKNLAVGITDMGL